MSAKIAADHLARGAVVYVRQSTMTQVQGNLESQRRQYALADAARAAGFSSVTVIDDDLGRSGSGLAARPGFQRLVAELCAGAVGAVFCIEASRLARNGRDWHHLVDLCAPDWRLGDRSGRGLRPAPDERPAAARPEGDHVRIRAQ